MTLIRALLALALLAVSANSPAAINCAAGTSTLYHLNFPPSAPDLEPALGYISPVCYEEQAAAP